jgi:hypothetical protein
MGGSVNTKKAALKAAMLDGWGIVRAGRELIQSLVASRRWRLEAVRYADGRNTRY